MTRSKCDGACWYAPWGIVTVGADGRVSAINPAGEELIGCASSKLLGQSEATLHASLRELPNGHQRIEMPNEELQAIYFLSPAPVAEIHAGHLWKTAEMLREPLASIQGFTELLLTQHYDDATRVSLTEMVLGEIEAMANIINQHLDVRKHHPAGGKESALARRREPGEIL